VCGIAGYIGQVPDDGRARLRAMADALIHRGPDDAGYLVQPFAQQTQEVGLAHRRLSIIDLNSGHQPIGNEDASVQIVFNGEIYNHRALRAQLQACGHRFATASDTETIVHAYEEYGDDCVKHLRGQFAIALWDARRERLLLARDRFGEKPLFYAWRDGCLLFGSEIKALLAWPGFAAEFDRAALPAYLQYRYVPAPATLFSGVRKLMPGCIGVWAHGALDERRYYTPHDAYAHRPGEVHGDPVAAFLGKFEETVAAELVADVPFGAFLSGGLDSSAVVAMMARHTGAPVRTYSVGFAERGYSELAYAAQVARAFGTEHHELTVSSRDIIDLLPVLAHHRDAPVAEPADVPIHLLAREARRTVKMVLTGEGSDECLGGYPKHVAEPYARWYQVLPAALRDGVVRRVVDALPQSARKLQTAAHALGTTAAHERMPRWFGAASTAEVAQMLGAALPQTIPAYPFAHQSDTSDLRRILYFDQTSWLPDNLLERGDRMTMAASLEARMPFVDHELVEFVASLPDDHRVRGRTTKWVLREAMKRVIPREILTRPKIGFSVPVQHWLRGEMRGFLLDQLLDAHSFLRAQMRPAQIERYVNEHLSGARNHEKLLWMLLNLEIWSRAFGLSA